MKNKIKSLILILFVMLSVISFSNEILVLTGDDKDIAENVKAILKFDNAKYDVYNMSRSDINIGKYSEIIIATESFEKYNPSLTSKIKNAVEKGATLFSLLRSPENPFNSLSGINSVGNYIDTQGMVLKKNIMTGIATLKLPEDFVGNSSLDLRLSPKAEVLIATAKGVPLLFQNRVGKGKYVYANMTMFQSNSGRGLLKQLLGYSSPDVYFYPTLNAKVMHIDDFPSPVPDISQEKRNKFSNGKPLNEFLKNVWWNDMKNLAKKYNYKYTAFMVNNYEDGTTKNTIEKTRQLSIKESKEQVTEILETKGEIGMHGFNHQPLLLSGAINFGEEGYVPWDNKGSMKQSINDFKEYYKNNLGEKAKIYSYVAPNNMLSKIGKAALVESLPNLTSISGIYYGSGERGVLFQDAGRDPDFPQIYALPRFSSGFFDDVETMAAIYDSIANYGYIAHFVHSDDLISADRNKGQNWSTMKVSYERLLSDLNKNFPTLRPMTQSELANEYSKIVDMNYSYNYKPVAKEIDINIKNYKGKFDAILRINVGKEIASMTGGTYKLVFKDLNTAKYLLSITGPSVKIFVK